METLLEKKENLINKLMNDQIDYMEKNQKLSTTHTTCSSAPAFGWSVEEYQYFPEVARRLREKGYTVTSSVNYGVTDWKISV